MRQHLYLAKWLGPWSDPARLPDSVVRKTLRSPLHNGESIESWLYLPTKAPLKGALCLATGLHYHGATDHRLVRLATVLAASGIAVCTPFIPDYMDLMVTPKAIDDFKRAYRTLLDCPDLPRGIKPGVFSISFGSLLALQVAADPELGPTVGGAVIFGGYADWSETIGFCLTGKLDGVMLANRDPLNQPVVYLNLAQDMVEMPEDPLPIMQAWMRYVQGTWGQDAYKRGEGHIDVARDIATMLPKDMQQMFLQGCGAFEDDHAMAFEALRKSHDRLFAYVDPRPNLHRVTCPVHLIHSAEDNVIPVNQLEKLASAMPLGLPVHTYKTGFYSHSGKQPDLLDNISVLFADMATMVRMMHAIVLASTG